MAELEHIFITSDHHFGSYKFPSFLQVFSQEQEKELIEKWNSVVGKNDLVYYNGDFCDGNVAELCNYAKQLNGQIILVRGNHDMFNNNLYRAVFKDIVDEVILDEIDLTIHHCPGSCSTQYEVFGHLHRHQVLDNKNATNSFCSCVQSNNGYPISLKKIVHAFHYDLS